MNRQKLADALGLLREAILEDDAAPVQPETGLLTVEEAARRLGLATKTLYRMSKDAPEIRNLMVTLPGIRAIRFSSEAIEEYLYERLGSRGASPIRPAGRKRPAAGPAPT